MSTQTFQRGAKVRVKPRKGQVRSGERGHIIGRRGAFYEVSFSPSVCYHKHELEAVKP
jgi:hypothetical protein